VVHAARTVLCCVADAGPRSRGSRRLEARSVGEGDVLPHTDAGVVGGFHTLDSTASDIANEIVLGKMTEDLGGSSIGGGEDDEREKGDESE